MSFDVVFACTSDEYFADLESGVRFDAVLVDGLHHSDQALRDVKHALRHLSPRGVVVMHDCSPEHEIHQVVPRQSAVWNGDVWRAMVALRCRDDVEAITLDTDYGVGLVRHGRNPNPLDVPGTLTWADLQARRVELLGLVPPTALAPWLIAS